MQREPLIASCVLFWFGFAERDVSQGVEENSLVFEKDEALTFTDLAGKEAAQNQKGGDVSFHGQFGGFIFSSCTGELLIRAAQTALW